jgi:hypothetical protein
MLDVSSSRLSLMEAIPGICVYGWLQQATLWRSIVVFLLLFSVLSPQIVRSDINQTDDRCSQISRLLANSSLRGAIEADFQRESQRRSPSVDQADTIRLDDRDKGRLIAWVIRPGCPFWVCECLLGPKTYTWVSGHGPILKRYYWRQYDLTISINQITGAVLLVESHEP